MEYESNEKIVLKHLQNKGSITSYEAFKKYDMTRLSAVIYNLRKSGYNIKSVKQIVRTKKGRHTLIAVYKLIETGGKL